MHGKQYPNASRRKGKPAIIPKTFRPQPQLQLQHQPQPIHLQPIHHQNDMRNLFHNISAKVQNPNVSAKDLATLTLMLLAGGISYKLLAEADAGVTSDAVSQYHLTGRTDTTWGDKMMDLNASIPKTRGGKTRRRSRK
jgi:hypothetical protein